MAEKLGLQGTDPLSGLFIRSSAVTIVLFLVVVISGRLPQLAVVPVRSITFFVVAGLLGGLLGTWTYYYVLKAGTISQVVPIAAAFPLITALAAVLILRENVTPLRVIGTCLIVAGIILVKKG